VERVLRVVGRQRRRSNVVVECVLLSGTLGGRLAWTDEMGSFGDRKAHIVTIDVKSMDRVVSWKGMGES
jgi:hypothetical protein